MRHGSWQRAGTTGRRVVTTGWLLAAAACGQASDGGGPTVPVRPPPVAAPPETGSPPPPDLPRAPFVVGALQADTAGWVEYTPGNAPLVLVAPHGGLLTPSVLPDRNCAGCVTVNDANTQALARAIADTFAARTGHRPHLVINRLHRRKFDGNRDLPEAAGGHVALLRGSWEWMHAAIDSARADVGRRTGRGLLIDLHGHAHAVPRLELGYLLSAAQLRETDEGLDAQELVRQSSIARLRSDSRAGVSGAALLRGAASLGALLGARGVPAVPSPAAPAPLVGEDYFTGGYNTLRHGSRTGGLLDAVQVECHFPGLRDTESNRAAFAAAFTDALLALLALHYGWRPA
jgi:hypothetical protein